MIRIVLTENCRIKLIRKIQSIHFYENYLLISYHDGEEIKTIRSSEAGVQVLYPIMYNGRICYNYDILDFGFGVHAEIARDGGLLIIGTGTADIFDYGKLYRALSQGAFSVIGNKIEEINSKTSNQPKSE